VRWPAVLNLALSMSLALAASARADELRDDGVPAQATLRLAEHHAPTPLAVPGARTVSTPDLRRRLAAPSEAQPILIDVLGGDGHDTLPGAVWLPGAGRGESFGDPLQQRLAQALAVLSGGERSRPLVFFCASAQCWLSYNAALRAVRLGYSEVWWYRGGIEAWGRSGGALAPPKIVWRQPG
jgi:PQQ-dependent catabolism-associated CXXCW motif protein